MSRNHSVEEHLQSNEVNHWTTVEVLHQKAMEHDIKAMESPTTPGSHDHLEQHPTNATVPAYAEHGALIDRSPTADMMKAANAGLRWPRIRRALREPFSEFMGTFMILMFGDGVVAQVVLSGGSHGDYQSISWGWGLGVMLGVYSSGISGAHLNPAVTFANCVFRKFPWRKFPIYMLAQVCRLCVMSYLSSGQSLVDGQRTRR